MWTHRPLSRLNYLIIRVACFHTVLHVADHRVHQALAVAHGLPARQFTWTQIPVGKKKNHGCITTTEWLSLCWHSFNPCAWSRPEEQTDQTAHSHIYFQVTQVTLLIKCILNTVKSILGLAFAGLTISWQRVSWRTKLQCQIYNDVIVLAKAIANVWKRDLCPAINNATFF